MIFPTVMWIDPGKLTGLAWLWESGTQFRVDEYGFEAASDQIEWTCRTYGTICAIGWEAYRPRRGVPQDDAHFALEMIGVCRYLARKHRCQVLPEGQPHDPNAADRKLLTAMGIWPKGKKDAQSAATHMVKYLLKTGNLPPAWRAAMPAQNVTHPQ